MSYSDEVMQSLSYKIRDLNKNLNVLSDLNNNMDYIEELNKQLCRANNLKELEIGLQVGAYTSAEAKEYLESLKIKSEPEPQKAKSFWKK